MENLETYLEKLKSILPGNRISFEWNKVSLQSLYLFFGHEGQNPGMAEMLKNIFSHSQSRSLISLELGSYMDDDGKVEYLSVMDELKKQKLPLLEKLSIGEQDMESNCGWDTNHTGLGSTQFFNDNYPQLKELALYGDKMDIGEMDLPILEDFFLENDETQNIIAVLNSKLPGLKRLNIGYVQDAWTSDSAGAFFEGINTPLLKHLDITFRSKITSVETVKKLIDSQLLKNLSVLTLDLSMPFCCSDEVSDEMVKAIESNSGSFQHLSGLNIFFFNQIRGYQERLKTNLRGVKLRVDIFS